MQEEPESCNHVIIPYPVIQLPLNNCFLANKALSLQARGLLGFLVTKTSPAYLDILHAMFGGPKIVNEIIGELSRAGYVRVCNICSCDNEGWKRTNEGWPTTGIIYSITQMDDKQWAKYAKQHSMGSVIQYHI